MTVGELKEVIKNLDDSVEVFSSDPSCIIGRTYAYLEREDYHDEESDIFVPKGSLIINTDY